MRCVPQKPFLNLWRTRFLSLKNWRRYVKKMGKFGSVLNTIKMLAKKCLRVKVDLRLQ